MPTSTTAPCAKASKAADTVNKQISIPATRGIIYKIYKISRCTQCEQANKYLQNLQRYRRAGLGVGQGVVVVCQAVAAGLADGVELVVG